MKVILKSDFTDEQNKLASELKEQLLEEAHLVEESGHVEVYGMIISENEDENNKILLSLDYGDPEETGNVTICPYY